MGNQLAERFIAHTTSSFIIAETGFGAGLNFLSLWQTFKQFKLQNPQHILQNLIFISVEKSPLSLSDMMKIHHSLLPTDSSLSHLANQLHNVWPVSKHNFDDIISWHIFFTDVHDYARQLQQKNIMVDAWFFDGFSPQKNPDMWSAELFQQLNHITRSKGSFATYSASGMVRRNLISAGFIVEKRKGFGYKREMLAGYKN